MRGEVVLKGKTGNKLECIEEAATRDIFEASTGLKEQYSCCLVVNYMIIVMMPRFHLNEGRNQ
jgi:hypothetical protein